MIPRNAWAPLAAGAAVLAALAYRKLKDNAPKNDQSWVGYLAEQTGAAVVDAVDGVLSGGVYAVGDKVGIPRTDADRGREALANGNYWEASFLLPAGDFISGTYNRIFN